MIGVNLIFLSRRKTLIKIKFALLDKRFVACLIERLD